MTPVSFRRRSCALAVLALTACASLVAACDTEEKSEADTLDVTGDDTAAPEDTVQPDSDVDTASLNDTTDTVDADLADIEEVDTFDPGAPEYALSETPYTTLQQVWAPVPFPEQTWQLISDGELQLPDIALYETVGIRVEQAPGEPWHEHDELAPAYDPAARPDGPASSLLYLWQVADSQLIDEESPVRFEGVYLAPVGSAYKPHAHLTTQVFESHVRTARRISDLSGRPFDLAVITGDLVDGGQVNELMWFASVMGGGIVDPDSGRDDDPIPGPGNDFNDPFYSAGIGVPWYPTIGNHEVLYSGFWEADDEIQSYVVGSEIIDVVETYLGFVSGPGLRNGFRDGSTPWSDVVDEGTTVPDANRRIASLRETMQLLYEAPGTPAGHGFTSEAIDAERGWYSFHPLPGKPLRVVCLATLSEDPASPEGQLDQEQYNWLVGELSAARDADELVIVASHHRTDSLRNASPVSSEDWARAMANYDNVVLHLTGHGHYSHKTLIPSTRPGGLGHWELMAPAVVDFPMQSRIVELVYAGDGLLEVYVTNVEHNAAPGTMAHEARRYASARKIWFSNDYISEWRERAEARNLLLRLQLPARLASSLEAHEWPTRIESLETLADL